MSDSSTCQIDYINGISNWNHYVARSAYFGAIKNNNKLDGVVDRWFAKVPVGLLGTQP
jgi:hypothetical protein